jgi:hypothetical protein
MPVAEPVRAEAHLPQLPLPFPIQDLGTHRPDAGNPFRCLDHPVHRGRGQGHVVVEEEDEIRLGGGRELQGPSHGAGEPQILVQPEDPAAAQGPLQQVDGAIGRRVVDGQHAQPPMGLAGQGGEGTAQPCGTVPRHEHGEDARGFLGLHEAGGLA